MKKIFLLTLLFLSAYVATSQDIIVTKQSERIDCKVEEISETEIKYRPKTNPTGPLMVINASKVATIMFENGQVYSPSTVDESPATDEQQEAQPQNSVVSQPEQVQKVKQVEFVPGLPIYHTKGNTVSVKRFKTEKYWHSDQYMNEEEYKQFIKLHRDDAWRVYRRHRVWGGILGWGGLGAVVLNTCLTPVYLFTGDGYSSGKLVALLVTEGVFLSSMTVGFILWNSAGRASVKKFNSTCGLPDYKTTLSLNAAPTGFGLTLNF